uniref:Uncharacterized protein n=1 Tax=Arundo donax TaxID=35708 RepID=A0A0A9B8U5_ARUDO
MICDSTFLISNRLEVHLIVLPTTVYCRYALRN